MNDIEHLKYLLKKKRNQINAVEILIYIRGLRIESNKKDNGYPVLQFFCDWTAHPTKTFYLTQIKNMLVNFCQTGNKLQEEVTKFGLTKELYNLQMNHIYEEFFLFKSLYNDIKSYLLSIGLGNFFWQQSSLEWDAFTKSLLIHLDNKKIVSGPCDFPKIKVCYSLRMIESSIDSDLIVVDLALYQNCNTSPFICTLSLTT